MRKMVGLAFVLSAGAFAVPSCAPRATSLGLPAIGPPPSRPGAATYYVDALHGADSNNGLSANTAFATIRRATANRALNGGDTILVMPGTYDETILVNTAGTPSGYTTIMGMPGGARPVLISSPRIYSPLNPQTGSTISIRASYVRVSGFDVTWQHDPTVPNAYGSGISLCCSLPGSTGSIPGPVQHHVDIDNNVVHDVDGAGVMITRGDYVRLLRNVVYGNAKWAPNQTSGIGVGYSVDYDHLPGYHDVIAFNVSYANVNMVNAQYSTPNGLAEIATCTTDGNGIIIDSNNGSQTNGIPYQSYTLIFGNLTYGNGGRGIEVYGSDHVGVINNTSFGDLWSPLLCRRPQQGELESDKSTYVSFYNNAVMPPAVGSPAVDISTTGDVWQNNVVGATTVQRSGANGLSVSGMFGGARPVFRAPGMDPLQNNFQLAPGSAGIHAGMVLSTTQTDLGNKAATAGAPVSVGAYFAQ